MLTITSKSKDIKPIRTEDDLVAVRGAVKRVVALLGFSLVNQTKVVTAASEIARNTLDHGCGGEVAIEVVDRDGLRGIALTFSDNGPGMEDVNKAMEDGYTTVNGMGLGLGGSKRLMDEFSIQSRAGEGTTVRMIKWLQ